MTFREWLLKKRAHDNMRGDFILDVRRDSAFPDCPTWEACRFYLQRKHACSEALEAAKMLWHEYTVATRHGRPLYENYNKGD